MAKAIEHIEWHAEESEKAIEKYLAEQVKVRGGICLKFASATEAGYPDRLICLPGGITVWAELKSKGKKPTRLQQLRHALLRKLGYMVYVIDSKYGVRKLIRKIFAQGAFSRRRGIIYPRTSETPSESK